MGRNLTRRTDSAGGEGAAQHLLHRLVGYSTQLLAADAAGIVLADSQRNLRVVATSSEDAELMELLQLQNDEGPCLDCYRTAARVSSCRKRPCGGTNAAPGTCRPITSIII